MLGRIPWTWPSELTVRNWTNEMRGAKCGEVQCDCRGGGRGQGRGSVEIRSCMKSICVEAIDGEQRTKIMI